MELMMSKKQTNETRKVAVAKLPKGAAVRVGWRRYVVMSPTKLKRAGKKSLKDFGAVMTVKPGTNVEVTEFLWAALTTKAVKS
jgi:hypothetical protein